MILLVVANGVVWAETICEVPAVFSVVAEERSLLDGGGVFVARSSGSPASLRAGDVIRQANGRRTLRCADLEAVAAEALAKGLVLLLATEREGRLLAVALPESTAVAGVGGTKAPPSPMDTIVRALAESERVSEPPSVPLPAPSIATPLAHREIPLPPRANSSAELTAKAVAAAAVLGTVDEAARFAVPLGVYERRIEEAKNAVAALRIESEGSQAVRSVVAEAFGYHEAARDIRRYRAAELSHARVDQRGSAAGSLPYLSDSEVPHWVERYPFLSESLQQAPRSTHMLLPGEMAGRWSPDQAVELLWEHASATAVRLGTWAAGR